ncbi:MAG: hypothetical protein HZB65_03320 [Candidatus Aenigmarchaeota archaeon]|nr:hypothetical protein [Candidatus Aenigmarchaeota archaeon]
MAFLLLLKNKEELRSNSSKSRIGKYHNKYTFHYKNKMTFFESHLSCQGKKYYTFLNNEKTLAKDWNSKEDDAAWKSL